MRASNLWHVTNGQPDASCAFPPPKRRRGREFPVTGKLRDFTVALMARTKVRLAWLTGEPVTLDEDYWRSLPSGENVILDGIMSAKVRKWTAEQQAENRRAELARARDDDPRWPLPSCHLPVREALAGAIHPASRTATTPGPRQEPARSPDPSGQELMLGRAGPGWVVFTVGSGPCVAWWTDEGGRATLGEALVESLGQIQTPGLVSIRKGQLAPWWLRALAKLNELEDPKWVLHRRQAALLAEAERSIACALIEASGGPLDQGLTEVDRRREGWLLHRAPPGEATHRNIESG